MRVYERFGFLVKMIILTVEELIPFIGFFALWVVAIAWAFQILKIADDGEGEDIEYPELAPFIKYLLKSYRNSIGDLSVPDYARWIEGENKLESDV